MSGGRFDTLLNQVQSRIETLENISNEFGRMGSLDQKRGAIARSQRDFTTIQNNITEMERLIQTMPVRDREFFSTDLDQCKESRDNLKQTYKKLDEQLQIEIANAKAREAEGLDSELVQRNKEKGLGVLGTLNATVAVNQDTINTQENTKATLAEDRALFNKIDNNLTDIDGEAEKGFKAGGRMMVKAIINGFASYVIIVILLGVLVVCILWRFTYVI